MLKLDVADVNPAISARDFANSSRALSHTAANATATMPRRGRPPTAQGHVGRGARAGVGGNSSVGGGIASRTSVHDARGENYRGSRRLKRRTSTACSLSAASSRWGQSPARAPAACALAIGAPPSSSTGASTDSEMSRRSGNKCSSYRTFDTSTGRTCFGSTPNRAERACLGRRTIPPPERCTS